MTSPLTPADRLAARILDLVLSRIPQPFSVGTVTESLPGGAGGTQLVTVVTAGRSLKSIPYLAHYTPVVGHVVLMVNHLNQRVIVGRIIGGPSA